MLGLELFRDPLGLYRLPKDEQLVILGLRHAQAHPKRPPAAGPSDPVEVRRAHFRVS